MTRHEQLGITRHVARGTLYMETTLVYFLDKNAGPIQCGRTYLAQMHHPLARFWTILFTTWKPCMFAVAAYLLLNCPINKKCESHFKQGWSFNRSHHGLHFFCSSDGVVNKKFQHVRCCQLWSCT
uniref:Uncharacterized protein n=1 Tax=Rhipicephalus microplus TaxID=6941 RepID=A0A6G5AEP4_RHIMP